MRFAFVKEEVAVRVQYIHYDDCQVRLAATGSLTRTLVNPTIEGITVSLLQAPQALVLKRDLNECILKASLVCCRFHAEHRVSIARRGDVLGKCYTGCDVVCTHICCAVNARRLVLMMVGVCRVRMRALNARTGDHTPQCPQPFQPQAIASAIDGCLYLVTTTATRV